MKRYYSLIALAIFPAGLVIHAGEISYNERFALGGDRKAALAELIPGIQRDGLRGGTYSPNDGQLSPLKTPVAFMRAARCCPTRRGSV